MHNIWFKSALVLALGVSLNACGSDDDSTAAPPAQPKHPAIEVAIAHVNDHHSHLEPLSNVEVQINGTATQVELGGFARIAQIFKAFDSDPAIRPNLIKLHAGDAVTGTPYYSFFKGAPDAAMMNTICFDAFALGNHEFDDGDQQLVNFLDLLNKTSNCKTKTPVLSANVVPKVGTPLAPKTVNDYIKPYTIKTMAQGVKVGIIGLTVAGKTQNSSRPLNTTQFLDEVTSAQKYINELKNQNIDHIVLLTHQGYDRDQAMAKQLTGVDVIIGGDSHTLLGNFGRFGLSNSGSYPTKTTDKNGKTVCIGQAWEYSKALGVMELKFDSNGDVVSCGGKSVVVIGDQFKQKDASGAFVAVSEATRQSILLELIADAGRNRNGDSNMLTYGFDPTAKAVLDSYTNQIADQLKVKLGTASEALCLMRVPGTDNRSSGVAGCESANTFARGSDVAQVVAEAFLQASRLADISLQNAGGVRIAIPAGEITNGRAREVLPFSNTLVEMKLTGQQLINALEDGVATGSGAHPYAAGMRWNLDLSKAKGQRISAVEVKNRSTGVWSAINLTQTYTLVTNDFIASGRDGYAALGEQFNAGNVVNTFLLYTDSFINYVRQKQSIGRPARADYSHKVVISATGQTLNPQ